MGGLFQLADKIAALAPFDPSAVQTFTQMLPSQKWIPHVAEVLAVPSQLFATDAELAEAQAADAQQQEMQQVVESMPGLAKAANDLSQASANVA